MLIHVELDAAALPEIPDSLPWGPLVARGERRGDYQNPGQGTVARALLDRTWAVVWPHFRDALPNAKRQNQALVRVDPGAPAQPFHCDADGDREYHTIVVPLTTEHEAGGTEFEDGPAFLPVRGLAYCFDGAVIHRGGAHRGVRRRVFAAFTVAPGVLEDLNVFFK
jgi:hypothetical protein